MADPIDHLREPAIDLSMDTSQLPGRDVLDRETLRALSVRSDLRGVIHFAGHVITLIATGILVHAARGEFVLLLPAMILHGVAIVTLFAPMHECVHRGEKLKFNPSRTRPFAPTAKRWREGR